MTKNRNDAMRNKTDAKRQSEEAYHNRETEKQGRENAASQRLSGIGSYLGGMGKLLGGAGSITNPFKSFDVGSALNALTRSNHPIWYLDLKDIPDSLSRFNFARPLGPEWNPNVELYYNNVAASIDYPKMTQAGIMVLNWEPCIGIDYSSITGSPLVLCADSAINTAAKQFYAFVRHANSGSTNYDSPDLMQYIIGIASLYGYWMHLRTLYGLLVRASELNDYVGKRQIEAMGYNYTDLVSHRAELFEQLEVYRVKLNTFRIPAGFHILERWMFLNGAIVKDCDITKSQFYMFKQGHILQWNIDRDGLTALSVSNNSTYSDIIFDMNSALGRYVDAEDAGIMSGDILHAYGDNVFKLPPVEINFTMDYIISDEILAQIKNATIVGPIAAQSLAVREDTATGRLYQGRSSDGWMVTGSSNGWEIIYKDGIQVTFYTDKPSLETCMVATRFTALTERRSDTAGYTCITLAGTEIITSVDMFYKEAGILTNHRIEHTIDRIPTPTGDDLEVLQTLSQFDWHPMFIAMSVNTDGDTCLYGFNDIGNSFPLPRDILYRYHRAAILSEFSFKDIK